MSRVHDAPPGEPSDKTVAIVGLGYVGLTTAACFASRHFKTIGIDNDRERIKKLKKGELVLHEPGLQQLIRKSLRSGNLKFSSKTGDARSADIIFVAVGTPSRRDGSIDLSQVRAAAQELGATVRGVAKRKTIVLRCTVVPGTTSGVFIPVLVGHTGKVANLAFCYNPEFTAEGGAVQDTLHPDRIVIGARDSESWHGLVSFYRRFYRSDKLKVVTTTFENAEMIKYASNAFLATKVSFINQIANLCAETPGCDVQTVTGAMGLDRRISPLFLRAGLGYGGSCFGKDMRALLAYARRKNVELPFIEATLGVNKAQPLVSVKYAEEELGNLRGKRVTLLGLAFKPGTDDMREAVSVRLAKALLAKGANVIAHDPVANGNARLLLDKRVAFADSPEGSINGSDCAVLVTEWEEFRKLTPQTFKRRMRHPLVIDGRRIYDAKEFEEAGVAFRAIGLAKAIG